MCFCIIVANDRLPDRKKYPPLPDFVLDNIRYTPWGAEAGEICLFMLLFMWIALLAVHKQRFIIMQRGFVLTGSLYLLRCLLILVTSIPVPDANKECDVFPESDVWNKMYRAFQVYTRMGMKVMGMRTCGDYIFSGHTLMLTLFNLFICEYTPKSKRYIHVLSWSLNILGMFSILTCRGHYTIDVVLAFYLAVQIFTFYHTLVANKNVAGTKERSLTWLCLPVFNWLEADNDDVIRNEFEWPLNMLKTGLDIV